MRACVCVCVCVCVHRVCMMHVCIEIGSIKTDIIREVVVHTYVHSYTPEWTNLINQKLNNKEYTMEPVSAVT